MNFGWMVDHISSTESFLDPRRGWDDPSLIVAAVLLLRSATSSADRVYTPLTRTYSKASQDWEHEHGG